MRNKERERIYQREWKRRYSLAHPGYRREYSRREQLEHPDRVRERRRRNSRSPKTRFSHFKKNARRREIEASLSFEQFATLTSLPCRYCGGPLPEVGGGIDRVDSSQGYTVENCVPCCAVCNNAKRDLTEDAFRAWLLKVLNHYIK